MDHPNQISKLLSEDIKVNNGFLFEKREGDWNGKSIDDIVKEKDQGSFDKWCYWFGQRVAYIRNDKDPKSVMQNISNSFQEYLDQYAAGTTWHTPGLKEWFYSHASHNAAAMRGYTDYLKKLDKFNVNW